MARDIQLKVKSMLNIYLRSDIGIYRLVGDRVKINYNHGIIILDLSYNVYRSIKYLFILNKKIYVTFKDEDTYLTEKRK